MVYPSLLEAPEAGEAASGRLVTAVSMQAGVNLCPLCANLLPWEGGVSNQLWEGPGEVPFA